MAVVILKLSGGVYYVQTIIVEGRLWRWDIGPPDEVSGGMLFWLWDALGPSIVHMSLDDLSAKCGGLVEEAWKQVGILPGDT